MNPGFLRGFAALWVQAQPAKEPADGSERKSTANQLFALIAERLSAAFGTSQQFGSCTGFSLLLIIE